jgi:hypothetical protein
LDLGVATDPCFASFQFTWFSIPLNLENESFPPLIEHDWHHKHQTEGWEGNAKCGIRRFYLSNGYISRRQLMSNSSMVSLYAKRPACRVA